MRRVRHDGAILWSSSTIYLSHLLVGEPVGIYAADGGWLVRYGPVELGVLDPANSRLREARPRRSGSWHRRAHRSDQ